MTKMRLNAILLTGGRQAFVILQQASFNSFFFQPFHIQIFSKYGTVQNYTFPTLRSKGINWFAYFCLSHVSKFRDIERSISGYTRDIPAAVVRDISKPISVTFYQISETLNIYVNLAVVRDFRKSMSVLLTLMQISIVCSLSYTSSFVQK